MDENIINNTKLKNSKKQNGKKHKNIYFTIIELILIVIIVFSGYKIYKWYIYNKKNMDTVAWIKVEGTDIDYPVVQSKNNDYYLNHSFDKSSNGAGWVFADYKNKFDGTDKNIVVYGHNRRDGSMFSSLKNILNVEWYNNDDNKYVTFITDTEFSIYQTENEDYYIKTSFSENEFYSFLQTIKNRSIKNFNVDVNENDSILTLSTCANDNKYRVVLHAKKIKEEVSNKGEENGDK